MKTRDESTVTERRELVLLAVVLVVMSRAAGRPDALLVAGLLPVVTFLVGIRLVGRHEVPRRSLEALFVPSLLTGGAGGAIALVPAGLGLVPFVAAFAVLLDIVLALELRLAAQPTGPTEADRARIMLAAVVTAFIAFTGTAALVPGGWAEPTAIGAVGDASRPVLTQGWLLVLALDDALVALILGFRLAVLRYGTIRDTARSALTYAIVVAVAAGALRALDVPRLVGPALLALVFYLWDALHGSAPDRRREPRFLWEAILLVAMAFLVIAWNLGRSS
jgi:hypothetical protein